MNLVLTNYTNPEYFFALPFRESAKLILNLTEQKKEQRTWEFYLTVQQTMVLLNPYKDEASQVEFETYTDFKKKLENGVESKSTGFTDEEKDIIRAKAQTFNERLVKQNEVI